MPHTWPALSLDEWRDTRDTLHLWTQVAGKVRLALAPKEPDWAQVTLYVTATGLTTSPMPVGDRVVQIDFDFVDHALVIAVSDGSRRVIPLVPQTVKAFHRAVLDALASLRIEVEISPKPQEIPDAIPFTEDEVHAAYDPAWANRFWQVLLRADTVLKEYRAGFAGRTTPVHFFWGSFDLAVTRYLGDAHLSAGFWPGYDRFPEPAFFAYTSPKPAGFEAQQVEPAAGGWDVGLGEFLLRYEDVRLAPSPREALLAFLESSYEAGAVLVSPAGQATPVPPSPQ